MRLVFSYFVLIFLFSSCKKDVGQVNYGEYPAQIGKIINNSCAVSGCHNAQSYIAASSYNLESWESMFKGSKSGSPVIPFSSRFSSLCPLINTYADLGIQSTPVMPLNRTPLSYEQVKSVKDWIDAGAPDINGNIKWGDNPLRKKLYACNQGCDVITVFDSETQLPIRYIEVGNKNGVTEAPHQVRVSPDGKYWYVIFINSNIMQKFNCSDDSYVASIPLTPMAAGTGITDAYNWNTFVISNDSKRAYCVSWSTFGAVNAVDLENHKLLHYLAVGDNPHAITINFDNTKIYVGAQSGNFINEIDTALSSINPFSLDGSFPSGTSVIDAHDIILSAQNNSLVITCQKSKDVRVFSLATNSVTQIISLGLYIPQEIVYSPATNQYYVTCNDDVSSAIYKIDATSYVATKLNVGYQVHGLCTDEKKKILYVLSRNTQSTGPPSHHTSVCAGRNGFVNFIDMKTFTLMNMKYEMSVDPYFINPRP